MTLIRSMTFLLLRYMDREPFVSAFSIYFITCNVILYFLLYCLNEINWNLINDTKRTTPKDNKIYLFIRDAQYRLSYCNIKYETLTLYPDYLLSFYFQAPSLYFRRQYVSDLLVVSGLSHPIVVLKRHVDVRPRRSSNPQAKVLSEPCRRISGWGELSLERCLRNCWMHRIVTSPYRKLCWSWLFIYPVLSETIWVRPKQEHSKCKAGPTRIPYNPPRSKLVDNARTL